VVIPSSGLSGASRPGAPSHVIQGFFPGGYRRTVQAPPAPAAPVGRQVPSPVQARAVSVPAPILPGRPATGAFQPARRSGPILPANGLQPRALQRTTQSRPQVPQPIQPQPATTAVPPHTGDAFPLPANFTLKPRGSGQPLPESIQKKMEAFFNTPFADVRVHVGHEATSIGALAFTHGTDLYFAPGQYNPQSVQGQQLLGHELTHVMQQRAGRVRNPFGAGLAVVQDRSMEAEAERMGVRAAAHQVTVQAKPAGSARVPVPCASQPPPPTMAARAALSGGTRGVAQLSPAVSLSGMMAVGSASYRIAAGEGGRRVGSVMVHSIGKSSIEITDLAVDLSHRKQGLGGVLMASAMRAGLQLGKSTIVLTSQDSGTGRLTAWYKNMGFDQVGSSDQGYPVLKAPISRALSRVAQARLHPQKPLSPKACGQGPVLLPGMPLHVTPLPRAPIQARPSPAPNGRAMGIVQRAKDDSDAASRRIESTALVVPGARPGPVHDFGEMDPATALAAEFRRMGIVVPWTGPVSVEMLRRMGISVPIGGRRPRRRIPGDMTSSTSPLSAPSAAAGRPESMRPVVPVAGRRRVRGAGPAPPPTSPFGPSAAASSMPESTDLVGPSAGPGPLADLGTMVGTLSEGADSCLRRAGKATNEFARKHSKKKIEPDAYFFTSLYRRGHNYAMDKFFDQTAKVIDMTSGFVEGVAGKLKDEAISAWDPRVIRFIWDHPEMASEYLSQTFDKFMPLVRAFHDPKAAAKEGWNDFTGVARLGKLNYRRSEGLPHLGRAVVDFTQGGIAAAAATVAGTALIFNLPGPRRNTKAALDRWIPQGQFGAAHLRNPFVKFVVTNPIMKVIGNPKLAAVLIGAHAAITIGKNINASKELRIRDPEVYENLRRRDRHVSNADKNLNFGESLVTTRTAPQR
jgi:ribosomal protein S18 acetylase RimI-like enzyme